MDTKQDPKELTLALLSRSKCAVQVAAVIQDKYGIFAWGWNSEGPSGMGLHAEAHAVRRANPLRLAGSTVYVAAQRLKNGRIVTAKPCEECQKLLRGVPTVIYRNGEGKWVYHL